MSIHPFATAIFALARILASSRRARTTSERGLAAGAVARAVTLVDPRAVVEARAPSAGANTTVVAIGASMSAGRVARGRGVGGGGWTPLAWGYTLSQDSPRCVRGRSRPSSVLRWEMMG